MAWCCQATSHCLSQTLKRKCLHFDEIFITGCTGSCQNDNFQCSQWLKFRQNDNIFVSVLSWTGTMLPYAITKQKGGNYLHAVQNALKKKKLFLSFLNMLVVEIFPYGKQGTTYPPQLISWQLITWWREGARASTTMVSTWFSQNLPTSALDGPTDSSLNPDGNFER